MNHVKTKVMDVTSDYYAGYLGRTLDEKMERIQFLWEEIQVYKALLRTAQRVDSYDQAVINAELQKRREYLKRNL